MLDWIIIILVVAAVFYAGDLPKVKAFLLEKSKLLAAKAKEKKAEVENKMNKEKKEDDK